MEAISSFVGKIVGLTIIVLIIVVAALPAITDAQFNQYTATNNEGGRYIISNSSDNVLIEMNPTTGKLSINGIEQTQGQGGDYEMIWAEKFSSRARNANGWHIQGVYDNNAASSYKSVQYSNGIVTLTTDNDATTTFESDWIMYPDTNGKYMQFTITDQNINNVFFNPDATIYVSCSFSSTSNNYVLFKGTYDNLALVDDYIRYASFTDAVANVSVTEGTDQHNLKFASAPTITLSNPDDPEVDDLTLSDNYVMIYVPIEYNAISDDDSMLISLIGIIPLLLLLVPVMLAVRMIATKNN